MNVAGSYFLYYTILFSVLALVYVSDVMRSSRAKKYSKFIFWISIILPIIIAGFRYGIGTDYQAYVNIYNKLTNSHYNFFELVLNTRYEPGWIALNLLVNFIFDDVKYVFIISALLTWVFFFKSIQNLENKISISIAVLILMTTMYNLSFNIVRQTLATSILMLSFTPLLNRQFFKFLIITILASSFHYTSLIFIPAYWIVNSRNEKMSFFKKSIAPVLFVILIIFINPILSYITSFDLFSNYSSYDIKPSGIGFGIIVLKAPVILIILMNLKKLKVKQNYIHKIVLLYFIGIILLYMGYFSPYAGRIAGYFEVAQVLILGAIVKVQNNKYKKLLYSFLIAIFFIALFTYKYLVLGSGETVPYQWILW